jgi:alpha-beta hydrolase superfamily lysophospholipase
VRALIAALREDAPVPVWLVGTSMGTVSAANAAARLMTGGPDGLVLTSTVTRQGRERPESVGDVRLKDTGCRP